MPLTGFELVGLAAIAATIVATVVLDWPKSYTLAVGLLAVFFLQMIDAWVSGIPSGLANLRFTPERLARGQDVWTIVTYAFLHGGPSPFIHIFGNLFILVTAGPALEDSTGPVWFLIIYALAGLAAVVAAFALARWTELVAMGTPMLGASGAIFGVLTAYAVRHPREKLPIILVFFVVWFPAMGVLLIYLGYNVVYMLSDFLGQQVGSAWFGHFAGFLVGLALAGRASKRAAVPGAAFDPAPYAHLGTTPRGREALDHLRTVQQGEEDVARAWLDVLADEAECPTCGAGLERDGLSVVCPEGHDVTRN